MSEPEKDEHYIRLNAHIDALYEHFETVHIFVTVRNEDRNATLSRERGKGNRFSRYGQIKCWVISQESAIEKVANPQDYGVGQQHAE